MTNSPINSSRTKIFISYSWDSEEHRDAIYQLSNRFCEEGLDCDIDQYEPFPKEGWPKWMENKVTEADFVLVICTETYLKRFEGKEKAGKGQGVKWESVLISNELYFGDSQNIKYLPVILMPEGEEFIPNPLKAFTAFPVLDITNDKDEGYEALYRYLTEQPKTPKPPLGDVISLSSNSKLSFIQRDKVGQKDLVRDLLKCPTLKNRKSFERLIKELQRDLSTEISFNTSPTMYVHNIVSTCLKEQGGIEKLINLLEYYEEDKSLVQEVKETLENIQTPKPITNTHLENINKILKAFSLPEPHKLEAIYNECIPKNIPSLKNNQTDRILNSLAKMGVSSTGNVPMFDFLFQLIPCAKEPEAKNKLREWIIKVAKHLKLTDKQIDDLSSYQQGSNNVLTGNGLKQIKKILKPFSLPDHDELKIIYERYVPLNFPTPENYQINNLLEYLAKMGSIGDNYIPIFYFLIRLLPYADESQFKFRLEEWIREVAKKFELTGAQIDELFDFDKSQKNLNNRIHLLIELEPEIDDFDENFIVHAWCVNSQEKITNISLDDDQTFELQNMPLLLGNLFQSINNDLIVANNELTIEFFLPFHLLCHSVEHWVVINSDQNNTPIGVRYPVVVRSRDRLQKSGFWPSWKAFWDNRFYNESPDSSVVWMEKEQPRTIFSKFDQTDALCLVMTFPHKEINPKTSMLVEAIKLGAPIALWARQIDKTDNIEEELKNLISENSLAGLPERIRKKRVEKWEVEEEHKAGYNLSLLWDDPNKQPHINWECPTQP